MADTAMLLSKLSRLAHTQCNSNLTEMHTNYVAFEIACSLEKTLELKKPVYMWSDINPDIKDRIGLPSEDVGIDYMDPECSFAGQAKCYKEGARVDAADIDRTRLCAYRARVYSEEDILKRCEFATTQGVKLGRSKIEMNDVDHKIIPRETLDKWYQLALDMPIVQDRELQNSEEKELRGCQIKALENIELGRINRIKMACGSGKTKVVKEVIDRKLGTYLVLVPYITLLEQWGEYLKQFEIDVVMIGTGYEEKIVKKAGRTLVIVCVYESYRKAMFFEKEGKSYYRAFEYIFVDEAHHVDGKEENYLGEIWKSINREGKSSVMVSASLGGETHYNYTLRDAINDGICCDYDIRISYFKDRPSMMEIAKYIKDNQEYLSILAYCNSIESARELAKECVKIGVTAASLSCEENKKTRGATIKKFKEGGVRVLISVNTLGEGINLKNADTCLFAEPRNSAISIAQCIGRVSRISEGKQMSHVVVCTDIGKEDKISAHPMVKILKALADDDVYLVGKIATKKSSRLRMDCVKKVGEKEEEYTERCDWVMDEVYDRMMNSVVRGEWFVILEMAKEFVKEHGRLPKQHEGILGTWMQYQRTCEKRKGKSTLSSDKRDLLDKYCPGWRLSNKSLDETWLDFFNSTGEYYDKNKCLPRVSRLPGADNKLGNWLQNQRARERGQTGAGSSFPPDRKKLLDDRFPNWLLEDDIWYCRAEELRAYVKEHGKLPPARLKPLGRWFANQQSKARGSFAKKNMFLEPEKMKFLDEISPGCLDRRLRK